MKVSFYVLALFIFTSAVATSLTMLVMINTGWLDYTRQHFVLTVLFNILFGAGFTLVFLLYFLRRHRELMALKQSFEHKLSIQNDLIKSRVAPHFFFNTINTLVSLVELNPPHAAELLQHVSALFRATFNGAREISFEDEVALREYFLAIESSRLVDKLVVEWELPNNDIMYNMVITALTLQNALDKMLLNVVEMTIETVVIHVKVVWHHHRVTLTITLQLPIKTLMITHDLRHHVDFHVQAKRLRAYFGKSASIKSEVTRQKIVTIVDYPLRDVAL